MAQFLRKNIFWSVLVLVSIQGFPEERNQGHASGFSGNYFCEDLTTEANSYPRKPLILILHFTEEPLSKTLEIFRLGKVLAHYTIDLNGDLYQHAPESMTLKQAGTGPLSYWHGYDVNSRSIGIEHVNEGAVKDLTQRPPFLARDFVYKGGYYWYLFPDAQMDRSADLILELIEKYGILPEHVLAHADVAPQRKNDPGPVFPWLDFAKKGISICYDPSQQALVQGGNLYPLIKDGVPDTVNPDIINIGWMQDKLANWGYQISQTGYMDEATQRVILAFNAHYLGNYDPFITHEAMAVINTLIHYRNHRDLPPQGS